MFARLFQRRSGRQLVWRLHGDIVAAARQPEFYTGLGVPDTFEGRFELLVPHVCAVVRRLNASGPPGPEMAQELTDTAFEHLDIALREIGVSDIGVPKRMKKLASAFFGRAGAYAEALASGSDSAVEQALSRNLYAGALPPEDPRVHAVANYLRQCEASLAQTPDSELLAGVVRFPPPPGAGEFSNG